MNYWLTLRHCVVKVHVLPSGPAMKNIWPLFGCGLKDRHLIACTVVPVPYLDSWWDHQSVSRNGVILLWLPIRIHNFFWMKCGIISGSSSRRSILHMNTQLAPLHHLLRSRQSSPLHKPSINLHPGAFGPWFCSVVAHFVAASHSKP